MINIFPKCQNLFIGGQMNIYICLDLREIWKLSKPRRKYTSAFKEYVSDMKKYYKFIPSRELFREIGNLWRNLSNEDKSKYIRISEKKNDFYLSEYI